MPARTTVIEQSVNPCASVQAAARRPFSTSRPPGVLDLHSPPIRRPINSVSPARSGHPKRATTASVRSVSVWRARAEYHASISSRVASRSRGRAPVGGQPPGTSPPGMSPSVAERRGLSHNDRKTPRQENPLDRRRHGGNEYRLAACAHERACAGTRPRAGAAVTCQHLALQPAQLPLPMAV